MVYEIGGRLYSSKWGSQFLLASLISIEGGFIKFFNKASFGCLHSNVETNKCCLSVDRVHKIRAEQSC
ncbi:hypothetical protein KY285_019229 [Solanum tuberosum]|nr:hypothetical protein KY285_019229 [Solanum tuberosum]